MLPPGRALVGKAAQHQSLCSFFDVRSILSYHVLRSYYIFILYVVRVEDFLSPKEESKSSNYTIVLFLPLDEPFKTHRKINKLKDLFQNRSKLIDIL